MPSAVTVVGTLPVPEKKRTPPGAVRLSQAAVARLAASSLLLIFVLAIFANFFVINRLVVPGEAQATADNLRANNVLFRTGIIAFLLVAVLDVAIAWTFHVLLEPVSRILSMLAAWFRLAYAAILAVALHHFLVVLELLGDAAYLSAFDPQRIQAEVMLSITAFNATWLLGLVLFGVHLVTLGFLVVRSGYMPRWLGILLMVAGGAYALDSLAHFLLPNYTEYQTFFLLLVAPPAIAAELALAVWLWFRGPRIPQMTA